MRLRHVLALLGVLMLLFLVLKEYQEPYVWLFIDDLLHPKPTPKVVFLSEGLAVRLYADTRPHTGKVARMQKGLILEVDGRELVEEGFGFGLPLVEVEGQAYLSRSASVRQADLSMGDTLVKLYAMDTRDTPSGFLRRKYEPVPPIGTVTVSYTVMADAVQVVVDLSGLDAAWSRVYLMNEQGARTFTRYQEPGLAVEGEQFRKWQPTTARRGCIVAGDDSLQFCVETESEVPRYYGRERYNQYYLLGVYALSWAGIDLELTPPADRFEYYIHIERSNGE
jgi:hypothetical protein